MRRGFLDMRGVLFGRQPTQRYLPGHISSGTAQNMLKSRKNTPQQLMILREQKNVGTASHQEREQVI